MMKNKLMKSVAAVAALSAVSFAGNVMAAMKTSASVSSGMYDYERSVDPFTDGARLDKRDPFTDGARLDKRDPFTDGGRIGKPEPFTDGARSTAGRDRTGVSADPSRFTLPSAEA